MARNRVAIGAKNNPTIILDNDNIVRCDIKKAFDPVGVELQIGTIEIVVTTKGFAHGFCPKDYPDGMVSSDGNTVYCLEADAGALLNFKYGTQIRPTTDGRFLGLFYVKETKQTGKNQFTIYGQDYVGVLDDFHTFGGSFNILPHKKLSDLIYVCFSDFVYTHISDILTELFGRVTYQSVTISDIPIYSGYIPYSTCREALQQVLMATNTCIVETDSEQLMVAGISDVISGVVLAGNTYTGGAIEYTTSVASISVVETAFIGHAEPYGEGAQYDLIFDNTMTGSDDDDNYIVIDGGPNRIPKIEGFSLHTLDATFCYAKGVGKIYASHDIYTKREVSASNPNVIKGESIKVDFPLINASNSAMILNRLKAYYFSDKRNANMNVVYSGELVGKKYEFSDPFNMQSSGYLSSQEISLSSVVKSHDVFQTGFEPYNNRPYTRSLRLTGSGTWFPPSSAKSIRVILVGGGSGGSSGLRGPDGKSTRATTTGIPPNKNGADGAPGEGGNIHIVDIETPAVSYTYSCGTGGAGGGVCANPYVHNEGSPGTDTVFGAYSSAQGARSPDGVSDVISGLKYGRIMSELEYDAMDDTFVKQSGAFWVDNGVFLMQTSTSLKFKKWSNDWMPEYFWVEGPELAEGKTYYFDNDSVSGHAYWAPGSSGGNAKGNGTNEVQGAPGQKNHWAVKNQTVQCGDGGNGATPSVSGTYPLDANPNNYGCGGGPGYGGGAGGNAGFMASSSFTNLSLPGNPGIGGNGGAGGRGAPGCIIIYY